jgi:hypothetical protein
MRGCLLAKWQDVCRFGEADNCTPGHAFRKNTAGAFGPDLAKKLSMLVKMEKNVMRSMEMVAKERMEAAVRVVSIHPCVA